MKNGATSSDHRTQCGRLWGLRPRLAKFCRKGVPPSRRAWNLAAREFDAVLRIKLLQFSADAPWKQIFQFCAEHAGENKQFEVGNTALLVFEARHRLPAGVPSEQLQFDGKLVLRPPLLLAEFPHLRTDDVQLCRTFFDACTLTIGGGQSWRLYLTLCEK